MAGEYRTYGPENPMSGSPGAMRPEHGPIPGRHSPDLDDKSLGELFTDLTKDFQKLVRQEVDLARTELSEKAAKAGKNTAYVGAGGFVAYAGFLAIVFAVAYLLAEFMPVWAGFLIVGVIVAAIGYAMTQKGISALKHTDFSLNRTTETLKEDKQWLKQEMK